MMTMMLKLLTNCDRLCAGFIYADWVDKVRPLNDATTVDIDLTKYYITSSAHRSDGLYRRAESAACVSYGNEESSASFPAHNSDQQASVGLRCIADSAPNIAAPYVSSTDSRGLSSSHLEAWQTNRRGRIVEAPPISGQPKQLSETNIAVCDLNLTNSMSSLIQSGPTSYHIWPSASSSSINSLAQPGDRKPPTGKRSGRMAKRTTRRLQPDDPETTAANHSSRLLRRPMSLDVVSGPDAAPLKSPKPSINISRNCMHSASSSVLPASDGTEILSTTPVMSVSRLLQRPVSVDALARPVKNVHGAPKTSKHGNRNQHLSVGAEMSVKGQRSSSHLEVWQADRDGRIIEGPPIGRQITQPSKTSPFTEVLSSALRQKSRDRRRCISSTNFSITQSTTPATKVCSYCQQVVSGKPGQCPLPRPQIKVTSEKPNGILSKKTISLDEVASGPRASNSRSCYPVSRPTELSVWYPRDVTNMADPMVGVACSHDSLSDEGYQTKDSGSTGTSSLNRL